MNESLVANVESAPEEVNTEAEGTEQPVSEGEASAEETLYAGKFKSVEAMEEGYKNAVQKLTEKRPEAPEAYEFDFTENADLKSIAEMVDFENDPLVTSMTAKFKDHNVPQDVAQDLVGEYLAFQKSQLPDPGEEIKKLGTGADEMLKTAKLAMNGLSPEAEETALQLTSTADGVKLLNELAKKYREKSIPASNEEAKSAPQQTSAELYGRAREIKRDADLAVNRKAEAEYNDIYKRAMELESKGL